MSDEFQQNEGGARRMMVTAEPSPTKGTSMTKLRTLLVLLVTLTACSSAETAIELAETATSAAPTTTVAEPSADTEPEADEDEPAGEPDGEEPVEADAAVVDPLAAPNGPELTADLSLEETIVFLQSLVGPTADLAGTAARLIDFPSAVTTMPDTDITAVRLLVDNDLAWNTNPTGFRSTLEIDTTTSALPADVILTYQTQLAAAGLPVASSGTQDSNGTTVHFTVAGGLSTGELEIIAYDIDDMTVVEVQHQVALFDEARPEVVDAAAGWTDVVPTSDSALLNTVTLSNFRGEVQLKVEHVLPGVDEVAAFDADAAVFAAAGWTVDDSNSSFRTVASDELGIDATVQMIGAETQLDGDFGVKAARTFDLRVS